LLTLLEALSSIIHMAARVSKILDTAEIRLIIESACLQRGLRMSKYAASVIGRQLREARQARSLSVAAAARVLKVSREMVYKY
jgi:uncharacterized membrane protein